MAARSFRDLIAWQEAYKLTIAIYKVTEQFPRHERFGLSSQIQRAAVSVCSNIAEGFGRRTSREKDQFYAIANGSLTEVENQLLIAKGIKYIQESDYIVLEGQCNLTHKILSGLQRANKLKGAGS